MESLFIVLVVVLAVVLKIWYEKQSLTRTARIVFWLACVVLYVRALTIVLTIVNASTGGRFPVSEVFILVLITALLALTFARDISRARHG